MNIYKLNRLGGYAFLNPATMVDGNALSDLKLRKSRDRWVAPTVEMVLENKGDQKYPRYQNSDYLTVGYPPKFTSHAIEVIGDMLSKNGEVLPLHSTDGSEYYVCAVKSIDALDKPLSEFSCFPDSERIMLVKKYAFIKDVISDADIFQVVGGQRATFVSQAFVDRVVVSDLKGFGFKLVWSSE